MASPSSLSESDTKTGKQSAGSQETNLISQEAEWSLAGVPDGLLMVRISILRQNFTQTADTSAVVIPTLVPTTDGYKCFVGGEAFWTPNALTYGYDPHAASTLITSPPSAMHLDIRMPGADMSLYFALSTIFSLGLRGIEMKLSLPDTDESGLQWRGFWSLPGTKRDGRNFEDLCL
ncbi:uncharacterized protein PHACADRAFT_255687 [Phanerochaete carnosa HHB-10118-sp]|uniref:GS catalytic domain-containing protein n=1 Tax=Phanerochaete carnosa (strain HHB-10118-sp) TaxID=650164 RepID=K5UYK0_PHACS|nr:uncharacterized protein PHACADRAFT_255687 [Phanerochaete carnosa HHB-10118-sp]EKM55226.1 hypothetical protein PHACADRAFT_255687 [Phanerochaete carnosa HHB-10118-sp]